MPVHITVPLMQEGLHCCSETCAIMSAVPTILMLSAKLYWSNLVLCKALQGHKYILNIYNATMIIRYYAMYTCTYH